MSERSSRWESAFRQWPALAGLWLVYLAVLGTGFVTVTGQVPLSLGQKAAVGLFLVLFALAEMGLLVLANAAFEAVTGRLRVRAPFDAGKALVLAVLVALSAASLLKFLTTRAHLRSSDLWFGLTNARQLLQESLRTELASTAAALAGFTLLVAGLFFAFHRLRRRPAAGGASMRSFLLLTVLAVAGAGVAYLRYGAVPVFARYLVPEIHWLSRTAAGPRAPRLAGGDGGAEILSGPAIGPYEPPASETGARRMNVVLIMLESIPWQRLGITGAPAGTTPHLDRLAAESVVFTRAYTPSVHSDYAQMAILSSLHPRKFPHHDYYTDLSYPRTLIWDALAPAGWTTSMFSCQNEHWGNMAAFLKTPGLQLFRHSLDFPDAPHKGRGSESKVFEQTVVEAWRQWLAGAPREPTFSYLNFQANHFPYVIPDGAPRPFTPEEMDFPASFFSYPPEKVPVLLNRFYNALHYADHWVGQVVATLRERGEWEHTALIVVSDHGEAFYEHEQPTHGTALYEEQVRSVLMLRLPGETPRWVEEPVSLLDLVPTLLAWLGLPPHGNFQGRGDVLEPGYRAAGRPFLFTIQGVTYEDGLLLDGWKYMINWDRHQHRLFHLEADPAERADLLASEPRQVERLQRLLAGLLSAQLGYYRERGWESGRYPPALP